MTTEQKQELCTRQCRYHEEVMARVNGSIAKSSIKWIATIFAIPVLFAILVTYAFVTSADYRYGSIVTATQNQTNIRLLDERTLNLKGEIVSLQLSIAGDILGIKNDLKEITKELRNNRKKE